MKVFLAGQSNYVDLDWSSCKYCLESFYYFKPEQVKDLKRWDMFLLDSGAFTFINLILSFVIGGNPLPSGGGRSLVYLQPVNPGSQCTFV